MKQFFITASDGQWNEAKSVWFEAPGDSKFAPVVIHTAGNPHWKGTITRLRLDPTVSSEAWYDVEYLRAEATVGNTSGDLNGDGVLDSKEPPPQDPPAEDPPPEDPPAEEDPPGVPPVNEDPPDEPPKEEPADDERPGDDVLDEGDETPEGDGRQPRKDIPPGETASRPEHDGPLALDAADDEESARSAPAQRIQPTGCATGRRHPGGLAWWLLPGLLAVFATARTRRPRRG